MLCRADYGQMPSQWLQGAFGREGKVCMAMTSVVLLQHRSLQPSLAWNIQEFLCPLDVPWSPKAKPPVDPRPQPEPGEVPAEALPMSLALPTFAIFPENEEKEGDEDSVLSWSDTPRRHGATDEAISAPCEQLCPPAAHTVLSDVDLAVVHDSRHSLAPHLKGSLIYMHGV